MRHPSLTIRPVPRAVHNGTVCTEALRQLLHGCQGRLQGCVEVRGVVRDLVELGRGDCVEVLPALEEWSFVFSRFTHQGALE